MAGGKLVHLTVLRKFRFDQAEGAVFPLVDYIYFICLGIGEDEETVSPQLHQDTCNFRIHKFDAEFFRADNPDLVVFRSIFF